MTSFVKNVPECGHVSLAVLLQPPVV